MSNIEQMQGLNDKLFNNTMEINSILEVVAQLPVNQKPERLSITPSKDSQVHRGIYDVVTVAGDENLVSENIKEGTSIFGVEGSAKTTDAKITSGYYLFYSGNRTDYIDEILALCEDLTNCASMFHNCTKLTELDVSILNTSNVTNMSSMFYGCSGLTQINLSNFNTENVTTMSQLFDACNKLEEIDISNFNPVNLTSTSYMFRGCSNLTKINFGEFKSEEITNMNTMFRDCNKLTSINLSNIDASKVTNVSYMFYRCSQLTDIKPFKNLGKGYTSTTTNNTNYKLDLSDCSKLTHESLMNVINNLYDLNLAYDVANGGTLYRQSLKLGSTNKAKLTAEEIAIATNKGWNVT